MKKLISFIFAATLSLNVGMAGADTYTGGFLGPSAIAALLAAPGPIGSTTPNSGAFTTLSAITSIAVTNGNITASNRVTGQTSVLSPAYYLGSGAGVLFLDATGIQGTNIGSTTPGTGKFTTLQATGLITPTSTIGIAGTAAADSAQAGSVGEYIESNIISSSSVALTTSVVANITSISLTAGDWTVSGQVCFYEPSGTTTSVTVLTADTSATSATFTLSPQANYHTGSGTLLIGGGATSTQPFCLTTVPRRYSIASTTTVYLVSKQVFTVSTLSGYGAINARRVR